MDSATRTRSSATCEVQRSWLLDGGVSDHRAAIEGEHGGDFAGGDLLDPVVDGRVLRDVAAKKEEVVLRKLPSEGEDAGFIGCVHEAEGDIPVANAVLCWIGAWGIDGHNERSASHESSCGHRR